MLEEIEYNEMKDEVKVEDGDDGKIELPAYPSCIFELPEDDDSFDAIKYTGDIKDMNHRMRHKLFYLWVTWAQMRNHQDIVEIISKRHEKGTESFKLCNYILNAWDNLARVLTITNLVEEILPDTVEEKTEEKTEEKEEEKAEE